MQEVGPSGDHKTSSSSDDNDDDEKHDHGLLSRLMSQLEKLESEPEELSSPAVSKTEITINGDSTNMNDNEVSKLKEDDDEDNEDKIVKELKKLNRQTFITNCLLSAIMVLTVTWQISQVSIILKVKDGVTRPFRSAGSLFTSIIKRHTPNEIDMVSPSKVEVIKHAVKQEVGPSGHKTSSYEEDDDDEKHDHGLVSRLMSQALLFNSRFNIFSGKLKTRWSGPFTITEVYPYGTAKLSHADGSNFKVNCHRLKHHYGGDVPPMVIPDLQTFPKDQ
nr:reverse transcriptase domain-containing protein [Tanacetum cinerariifolium]